MEVDNPTPKVGYNPKLFNDQQAIQNYICAICNNVLKDAVQIPQSADPRRACHDCYNSNIRYSCTSFIFKAKPPFERLNFSTSDLLIWGNFIVHCKKAATILDKIIRKTLEKLKPDWTRIEYFNICFCPIFDFFCQKFISGGDWALG